MSLVIAEDWSTLESEAERRLAADPLDGAALHALGRLAIDGDKGSEELRQSLLPKAEACIKARPYDGLCQLAYGQILGTVLNGQGGLAALGSVGRVQQALEAAVADLPDNFDARESLVNFYLQAPGFVGGSTRKAIKNADAFVKFDPDRARLLFAQIDLQQESPSKAEDEMSGLKQQSGDPDLDRLAAKRWLTIGLAYVKAQDHDSAVAALTRAAERGAPSVIQEAREALERITASRQTAQASQAAQAGGGGMSPSVR
jgi:tetratricopeptide (TPR) repeat protein